MRAIITVFKVEFEKKREIQDVLKSMSVDVKEIGEAFVFDPKPGQLFEFLNITRNHDIVYSTHFPHTAKDQSPRGH